MNHSLFTQAEKPNPYLIYEKMLNDDPIYFDETNQIWVVYSYELCEMVLKSTKTVIPEASTVNLAKLNPTARNIRKNLVRLNNMPAHGHLRPIVSHLFSRIRTVHPKSLLDQLLNGQDLAELDWVSQVCQKLPPLSVLSGFGFSSEQTTFLLQHVATLVKIMSPNPSEAVSTAINTVIDDIYSLISSHLAKIRLFEQIMVEIAPEQQKEKLEEQIVSNLIGFLIQSYDAGRGLLSNALLDHFNHRSNYASEPHNGDYFAKLVGESLRHNPSVQNTKRVVIEPIRLNQVPLQVGSTILVVLAAANRDPEVFHSPADFDINRPNNAQHLTFGTGIHACVAKHFISQVASEALTHLFEKYPKVRLLTDQIKYKPLINVRLPQEIKLQLI